MHPQGALRVIQDQNLALKKKALLIESSPLPPREIKEGWKGG